MVSTNFVNGDGRSLFGIDCQITAKAWRVKEIVDEEFDRIETVELGEQLFAVVERLPVGFSWSRLLCNIAAAATARSFPPFGWC